MHSGRLAFGLNWIKFNEKGVDEKKFCLLEMIKKKKKIIIKIIKI
ncbi:hypothetical protein BCSAG_33040 [Bacillus cereus]